MRSITLLQQTGRATDSAPETPSGRRRDFGRRRTIRQTPARESTRANASTSPRWRRYPSLVCLRVALWIRPLAKKQQWETGRGKEKMRNVQEHRRSSGLLPATSALFLCRSRQKPLIGKRRYNGDAGHAEEGRNSIKLAETIQVVEEKFNQCQA